MKYLRLYIFTVLTVLTFILILSGCGAQKLEFTEQYKAIAEISADWTEQTSLGTILAAEMLSETVPGVLYDEVIYTGNKATVADAYAAWQAALDQYYDDTQYSIYGRPKDPEAYAKAVDPGNFDDKNPRTLLSSVWTLKDNHTVPDDVASALETAVFDGTEYATAFEEPVNKKDIDITVGGVRYAGFILVEPDYNLYEPDTISVTVVLAYIPSSKSTTTKTTTKATIESTTEITTKSTTEASTEAKKPITTKAPATKADDLVYFLDYSYDGKVVKSPKGRVVTPDADINKAWNKFITYLDSYVGDEDALDEMVALIGDVAVAQALLGKIPMDVDNVIQYMENTKNSFADKMASQVKASAGADSDEGKAVLAAIEKFRQIPIY